MPSRRASESSTADLAVWLVVWSSLALGSGCTGNILGDELPPGAENYGSLDPGAAPNTSDPAEIATPDGVGYATRFPKLSNAQWEASVSDLFYLPAATGLSETFTPEPADAGYDNEAAAGMTIAGDAWARYQLAAEQVAERVTSDPQLLAKLLPTGVPTALPEKAHATISDLGLRAYRRPLSEPEQSRYWALFDQGAALDTQDPFRSGMRLVIQALLQSPHFLYRVEASTEAQQGLVWLSGYEAATRLAYAFWNSTPPRELLTAASAGELKTAEGVKKWATRLLADPRAAAMLARFHEQTFHIDGFGTQDKDDRFAFDAQALAPVLKQEAAQFFTDVLSAGGGIRELLTNPVAFVNEQTATFYGISGIAGSELQRVALDPTRRAGLFSQLGYLAQTGSRAGSDPVHRGLGILRQVLCDDPDPPPPITIVPPTLTPGLTTRQIYQNATACGVGCHDTLINPPGFAFEHFDTVGRWRDDEGGLTIDAKASLGVRVGWTPEAKREAAPITIEFDGAADLMAQLATLDRTHECYARHLLQFVLAKPVSPQERGAGRHLAEVSKTLGAPSAILAELVTLNAFRARAVDPPLTQ